MEKAGLPSVTVVSEFFVQVAKNTYSGVGVAGPALAVVPQAVLAGATKDVTPSMEKAVEDVIHSLTVWSPAGEKTPAARTDLLRIEGADYEEAVDRMNALFLEKQWSDGLPLLPPTSKRIKWLLQGADLAPGDVVGKVGPRGGIATVETVAANAAMAGARPEHMPVIIAALSVMTRPAFLLAEKQATTNPVSITVVVNGPIARQIGINSGYGCLGPSPQYPAGAAIGRSLRLIMMNVGGAVPGVTDMAVHGQPSKFNCIVLAEAEESSPWPPLHVDRGFARDDNCVTVYGTIGTDNYGTLQDSSQVNAYLGGISKHIAVPSGNSRYCGYDSGKGGKFGTGEDAAGILLFSPPAAKAMEKAGWTKSRIKSFLFENARISLSDYISYVSLPRGDDGVLPDCYKGLSLDMRIPMSLNPESFIIVVAGGDVPYHSVWLPAYHGEPASVTTAKISLPGGWSELLKRSTSRDIRSS